jgi:DNA repair protein RecO (recombination protein O)
MHSTRWSESSKIVELFTPEHGYLKVIAKGAFRPKSDFRGMLESFNYIETVISKRDTRGLQILSSATLLNSFLQIKDDIKKLGIGFSILELIRKFFKSHEPSRSFFNYLVQLFDALDDSNNQNIKIYLWHFLLNLSLVLGFEWTFGRCLGCQQTPNTEKIFLDYKNGRVLCNNCRRKTRAEFNLIITRETWSSMQKLDSSNVNGLNSLISAEEVTTKIDLTGMLLEHLSYHTEDPIELKALKWYG